MPEPRLAERLRDYPVASVEEDGSWIAVAITIKRNEEDTAAVEVEFVLSDAIVTAKALATPVRDGRCRIYIEQTRRRPQPASSASAKTAETATTEEAGVSVGALIAYEYDLVDDPYRYALAYHFHGHGDEPYYHGHETDDKGARRPFESGFVALDDALNAFIAAVWRNRFPPVPTAG